MEDTKAFLINMSKLIGIQRLKHIHYGMFLRILFNSPHLCGPHLGPAFSLGQSLQGYSSYTACPALSATLLL